MTLIDGKKIANDIKQEVKLEVEDINKKYNVVPKMVIFLVGNNPSSEIYVRNKVKLSQEINTITEIIKLPTETTEDELLAKIKEANEDNKVHGILVQLPLPKHISEQVVLNYISPNKDVDCFNPYNVGKLWTSSKRDVFLKNCTPMAVIELLKRSNISIEGKHAVIIGRSNIVGKPVAGLLLNENATVTICHSKTTNLKEICKTADILVVAIGKAKFIDKSFVKNNAVVIDVGINYLENKKICGDVNFEDVKDVVSAITPVPGGVGPMTVMMLLKNLIQLTNLWIERNK